MTDRRGLRCLTALLTVATALAGCGQEPPGPVFESTVNVGGAPSSPGWGYGDSAANRRGFDHDLTNWLGQQIGFTPVPVMVTTRDRETALKNGIVKLVVATYSITDTRKKEVSFAGPYMLGYQGVMIRAADRDRYARLADLRGKTVCATTNSTSIRQLNELVPAIGIVVVAKDVYDQCLQALRARTIDAISTDQLLLYGMAMADPQAYVLPDVTFGQQERWGIGLPKGDKAKCEVIRKQLGNFLATDTWDVFFEKNLPGVDKTGHKPEPSQLEPCT
jgi:glutamate transport system substrate-binding protein